MEPRWVLAGEDGSARRRAYAASGIIVGKAHPLRGEPVNVRRFVKCAALAAKIGLAQVIREDENDVWFLRRGGVRSQRREHKGCEDQKVEDTNHGKG